MSKDFYPAVDDAIKVGATLPTTTYSIERLFSILRRVAARPGTEPLWVMTDRPDCV